MSVFPTQMYMYYIHSHWSPWDWIYRWFELPHVIRIELRSSVRISTLNC